MTMILVKTIMFACEVAMVLYLAAMTSLLAMVPYQSVRWLMSRGERAREAEQRARFVADRRDTARVTADQAEAVQAWLDGRS